MVLRYIAFILLLISVTDLNGQAPFHRIFEVNEQGDTLLHHLASTTNQLGQFISVLGRQVDGEYKSLVFTKQDNKGNFERKLEYKFGDDDITDIYAVDLVINEEVTDSIYFTATLTVDEEPQSILGKLHATQLNGLDAVEIFDFNTDPNVDNLFSFGHIVSYHDSTNIYTFSDTSVVLCRMNIDNEFVWSTRFNFRNEADEIYDAEGYDTDISITDSTIYSMGLLSTFELYQLVVDSQSVEHMAKRYTLDGNVDPVPTGIKTIGTDDAVMSGYYQGSGGNSVSYVIMTDTIGDVLWAKDVTIENSSTEVYKITQSVTTGEIVIAGKFFPDPDSTQLFSAGIDLLGNVQWISSYGPVPVDADLKTISLDPISDGGVNIAANGLVEAGGAGIIFIKQVETGNTNCSDTLEVTPFADLIVTTLSLIHI